MDKTRGLVRGKMKSFSGTQAPAEREGQILEGCGVSHSVLRLKSAFWQVKRSWAIPRETSRPFPAGFPHESSRYAELRSNARWLIPARFHPSRGCVPGRRGKSVRRSCPVLLPQYLLLNPAPRWQLRPRVAQAAGIRCPVKECTGTHCREECRSIGAA